MVNTKAHNPKAYNQTDTRLAARCAAVAAIGASFIHLAVMPVHWADWWVSGVFFVAMTLAQLGWAVIVWSKPTVPLLAAGIAVNGGAAALWIASRTVGAPFGPHAGQTEAVDAAGICVLLLECYVVMGAAWAWLRNSEPEQVSGFSRALVLTAANTVMGFAVLAGLASIFTGHPHQHVPAEASGAATEYPAGHAHPEAPAESGLPVTDMAGEPGAR